jgi:hypothetical protein
MTDKNLNILDVLGILIMILIIGAIILYARGA